MSGRSPNMRPLSAVLTGDSSVVSNRGKRASLSIMAGAGTVAQSVSQTNAEPATQLARNQARKADLYAVGRILSARAQRDRQGKAVRTQLMTEADGIPVKELLQTQYRLRRDKTIRDSIVFILQFGLLLAACFNVFDVHECFSANDAVRQQLVRGYTAGSFWKKTFYDIGTTEELEDFFSDINGQPGPFLKTLFPTRWYDGVPLVEAELPYVMNGNTRLLGGVQIRISRVSDTSCDAAPRLSGPGGACYAPYSPATAFEGVLDAGNNSYDFGMWHPSALRGRFGAVRQLRELNYGRVQHSFTLDAGDYDAALAKMQAVIDDGLLQDPGLRAIAATFNLYNTQTRFVTVVRIIMEVLETGYFIPSSVLFTVPVPELFITNTRDKIVIALLVAYVIGWIYYVQKEIKRIYYHHPRYAYFFSPQNLFEFTLQVITTGFIILYIQYIIQGLGPRPIDVNDNEYSDMFDYAWHFTDTFLWGGITGLLSSLKIFRYLSINKRMNTLWLTLSRARYDLAAFSVALIVCLMAFAFMGQLAFGYRLEDYRDFGTAVSTLTQYILGNFSYEDLADARPWIAWCFFGLYICVVNIVVINLIIAIVSKYFEEVHNEINRVDKWKQPTSGLEQDIVVKTRRFVMWLQHEVRKNFCFCCNPRHRALYQRRRLCWHTMCTPRGCCAQQLNHCGCSNRCTPKCWRTPGAGTVEDPADDELDLEELLLTQQDEATRRFWKALSRCTTLAKRKNYLDLFDYFERLYEDTVGSDSLYIGVHELCSVVRQRACNPTAHRDCEARELVSAYCDMKLVLMVGRCQQHKPVADELRSNHTRMFRVYLVSRIGFKIERKLFVDEARGLLMIFDKKDRLVRQLPLTQLIQLEKSSSDMDQLHLVFTSQGVPVDEEEVLGSLEVVIRVRFKSDARREEFLEMILRTQAALAEAYQGIMSSLHVDDMDQEDAANGIGDVQLLKQPSLRPSQGSTRLSIRALASDGKKISSRGDMLAAILGKVAENGPKNDQ